MMCIRIVIMVLIGVMFLSMMVLFFGCHGPVDTARFVGPVKAEPNQPVSVVELAGEPAKTITTVIATNIRDAGGRENALFDTMKKTVVPLIALMVGGLIFWGITRSKWGWVIPAAALVGLGFITLYVQVAKYIIWGIVALSFLVIVWKAYEYQQERNEGGK